MTDIERSKRVNASGHQIQTVSCYSQLIQVYMHSPQSLVAHRCVRWRRRRGLVSQAPPCTSLGGLSAGAARPAGPPTRGRGGGEGQGLDVSLSCA